MKAQISGCWIRATRLRSIDGSIDELKVEFMELGSATRVGARVAEFVELGCVMNAFKDTLKVEFM